MGLILDMTIACLFRMKVFILPTPLADEYTCGVRPIDPVVRPSCGLLALPHVGLDASARQLSILTFALGLVGVILALGGKYRQR